MGKTKESEEHLWYRSILKYTHLYPHIPTYTRLYPPIPKITSYSGLELCWFREDHEEAGQDVQIAESSEHFPPVLLPSER
jgi:hypothetical protein